MGSTHSTRYQVFLERLRNAREEAGLTQRQVSKAIGMPQPLVSKCETGERRVDVIELDRFAELYGKPLRYFVPRPGSR